MRKIKSSIKNVIMTIFVFLISLRDEIVVLANGGSKNKLMESKPVKGLFALIADAQAVLLAVEAVLVVILLIWTKIKEQAAEDEEKPKFKKQFKMTWVSGIVIICLTAIVPVVLGYFQ